MLRFSTGTITACHCLLFLLLSLLLLLHGRIIAKRPQASESSGYHKTRGGLKKNGVVYPQMNTATSFPLLCSFKYRLCTNSSLSLGLRGERISEAQVTLSPIPDSLDQILWGGCCGGYILTGTPKRFAHRRKFKNN